MTRAVAWGETLPWGDLLGGAATVALAAGPEQCVRIAEALGLEGLAALEAELHLRPWLDGVEVEGRVRGRALRICGITLDPLEEVVDESLRLRVVPAGSPNAPRFVGGEAVIDLEAEDPPDEAPASGVDLSAYVTEAFALALDPFPRKPDAEFVAPQSQAIASPFAVLAALARREPEG